MFCRHGTNTPRKVPIFFDWLLAAGAPAGALAGPPAGSDDGASPLVVDVSFSGGIWSLDAPRVVSSRKRSPFPTRFSSPPKMLCTTRLPLSPSGEGSGTAGFVVSVTSGSSTSTTILLLPKSDEVSTYVAVASMLLAEIEVRKRHVTRIHFQASTSRSLTPRNANAMPRLNEQPTWTGVSIVWRSRKGVLLLLGNTSNALAAVSLIDAPGGVAVKHVISVGDNSKNRRVARERTAVRSENAVPHDSCPMDDRLSPEDAIAINATFPPLVLLSDSFAACEVEASRQSCQQHSPAGLDSAVLVHCNMGHNRSPALVLAFLLLRGLSLRDAYRHLLVARPTIDPLPNYRRALCRWEKELWGSCSVSIEPWALHVSDLLREDGPEDWEAAWAIKEGAIRSLLAEAPVAGMQVAGVQETGIPGGVQVAGGSMAGDEADDERIGQPPPLPPSPPPAAAAAAAAATEEDGFGITARHSLSQARATISDTGEARATISDMGTWTATLSTGRVYEQHFVALDEVAAQDWPSPTTCLWPTAAQADNLVALLVQRGVSKVVSIGCGEGACEALLEARGLSVDAIDVDVLSDTSRYAAMRQFCSCIRRVRPDSLYSIPDPEQVCVA